MIFRDISHNSSIFLAYNISTLRLTNCMLYNFFTYFSGDRNCIGGTALVEAELIPVFESMLQVSKAVDLFLFNQIKFFPAFLTPIPNSLDDSSKPITFMYFDVTNSSFLYVLNLIIRI